LAERLFDITVVWIPWQLNTDSLTAARPGTTRWPEPLLPRLRSCRIGWFFQNSIQEPIQCNGDLTELYGLQIQDAIGPISIYRSMQNPPKEVFLDLDRD